MVSYPFDVNDKEIRTAFFDRVLVECIDKLDEHAQPEWGSMTPQHMLEHLLWAFEYSNGILDAACRTPEAVLERSRRFLHDNRPTPHEFKNPLLGDIPPPLKFRAFAEAQGALRDANSFFVRIHAGQPETVRVHPIFGPLSLEEWQRSHFKHCYHHLLQFGLIGETGS
jgi:oxepin-CoA hydrolase/3-oxo-5,6-dehydrosuberyl-CoA semialdehyde dehydrogenase